MKAELRLEQHTQVGGAKVIEVWYAGKMIMTVTGADGPGVRVISKYHLGFSDQSSGPLTCFQIEVGHA